MTSAIQIEAVRQALIDDVASCWITMKTANEQVHRRNYVRAVFAFVDGTLSAFKAHVLQEHDAGRFSPAMAELALLREEAYDADEVGRVKTRQAFIPFKTDIRFTLEIFRRAHELKDGADYTGQGWQSFQRAITTRHRVTHPKVTVDLDISDSDLKDVEEGLSWFLDATFVLFVKGRARVLATLQAARASPT